MEQALSCFPILFSTVQSQIIAKERGSTVVFRVHVEKKPGFDVEAQQLTNELRTILGIESLNNVRIINRYDVEGISEELFGQTIPTVFSEPQVDNVSIELPDVSGDTVFAVESLPGQFDQRADSASECIQLISQGERPTVRSARVYVLDGQLGDDDLAAIKKYVINPVETREAGLETRETLATYAPTPSRSKCSMASAKWTMHSLPSSSPIGAWQWTRPI